MKKTWLALAAALMLCRPALADFYFEQDVHETRAGLDGAQDGDGSWDFKRRTYVVGQLLAVQIEEKGKIQKEYGFDFAKNLYYEADPAAGTYQRYDLDVLGKAFDKMAREVRTYRGNARVAEEFAHAMLEGQIDYPVHVHKAWWGAMRFGRLEADRYRLRTGPGTSFLNFFGWYRKAEIWASSEIPGISEYSAVRMKLRRRAAFYKIKHNRISDFITTIAELEPLPLRIESTARRRFERATAVETSTEAVTAVRTKKIDPSQLLYFRQAKKFSWSAVYSKGTVFGPEVALQRGEPFNWRRSAPWLILPAFFLVCTALWFLGPFSDADELSLGRKLVLYTYLLSALLFAIEAVHYLSDLPYIVPPLWEYLAVAAAGVVTIAWQARCHRETVERRMRESNLRWCPHCRARCEEFYVVCPKCNRDIMPAQAHGTTIPPK